MIHYANTDENAFEMYELMTEKDSEGPFRDMFDEGYLLRIVRSQDELIEKINIFDAGLDDRIIEIIKIFVLAKFQEEHPEDKDFHVYFVKGKENRLFIEAYVRNVFRGNFQISQDFYEEINKEYSNRIPDLKKDDPCIDRQWALKIIGIGK